MHIKSDIMKLIAGHNVTQQSLKWVRRRMQWNDERPHGENVTANITGPDVPLYPLADTMKLRLIGCV